MNHEATGPSTALRVLGVRLYIGAEDAACCAHRRVTTDDSLGQRYATRDATRRSYDRWRVKQVPELSSGRKTLESQAASTKKPKRCSHSCTDTLQTGRAAALDAIDAPESLNPRLLHR